jgi:drug efflux transport system permease protein
MTRVLAQMRKEIVQLARDRLALALVLVLPLVQLVLMGSSMSFIVRDLPIVVQDLDASPASRELIDGFRGSLTFRIVAWPTDRRPEDALTSNAARGVVIIPTNFGRDLTRGVDAHVQLIVDGSDGNTARLLSGYAGGVAAGFNAKHGAGGRQGPVRAAVRYWYNPGRSSNKFYGPGIFVMGLSMFPPLLATLAMAREGERKTILQVYVSNISAYEFLAGKVLAFMIVAFAESLLAITLLFTVFGLGFVGDPTPFLVATVFYAFCVASFGTMVGAAIPNQVAAMQAVMMGGFLFTFMLSGLLFPLSNVPGSLRWISYLVWARYYIEVVRDAFLQGGSWPAVWHKVLAIGGIGALFFTLAWRRMRRMQLEV